MDFEPSSLELKLLSCKELKSFNFFQKLTLYALVFIDTNDPQRKIDDNHKQHQKTPVDRSDGDAPEWNHEMKFDLRWVSIRDCDHLFFHFEFRHDGVILGNKLVGEVRVPLRDLILDAGQALGVARFVNYEVRNGDGKPNGIFSFSYKLIGKKGLATGDSFGNLDGKISGYPVIEDCHDSMNSPSFQRPALEIQTETASCGYGNGSIYPSVPMSPVDPLASYLFSPPEPPSVSSPSPADFFYCYPPPSSHFPPPPPVPHAFPFPFPPPPPGSYGPQYFEPIGPEAHRWVPDPMSRGW